MESSEWVNSAVNQAYFNRESIASGQQKQTQKYISNQILKIFNFIYIRNQYLKNDSQIFLNIGILVF